VLHACFLEDLPMVGAGAVDSHWTIDASAALHSQSATALARAGGGSEITTDARSAPTSQPEAAGLGVMGTYIYGASGTRLTPSRLVMDPTLQAEVWHFLGTLTGRQSRCCKPHSQSTAAGVRKRGKRGDPIG